MKYYELMMVVAPQVDEEGLSATLERVNHYVSERGGSIVRQERWGRLRRLAYPIKNYNEGNYVLTHLEMNPQDTKELEANLILAEDVLRHLLVSVDAIPEARQEPPQAVVEAAEGPAAEAIVATEEQAPSAEASADAVADEPVPQVEDQAVAVEDEPEPTPSEEEPQENKEGSA